LLFSSALVPPNLTNDPLLPSRLKRFLVVVVRDIVGKEQVWVHPGISNTCVRRTVHVSDVLVGDG